MNTYINYFKNHYNNSFTYKDIENYRNWFSSQWIFINSKIGLSNSSRILEIGSGIGGLYSILSDYGIKEYIGLEMDINTVNFSKKLCNSNSFKNVAIESFKSKKKFNYIFAFEVLGHLYSPIGGIKKINELLKTQGTFCGTSPYPYVKNISSDQTHNFVLHPENWKKLFIECGYTRVNIYPMTFFPYLWRVNSKINIRLPFYLPFPSLVSTCLIIAKK